MLRGLKVHIIIRLNFCEKQPDSGFCPLSGCFYEVNCMIFRLVETYLLFLEIA